MVVDLRSTQIHWKETVVLYESHYAYHLSMMMWSYRHYPLQSRGTEARNLCCVHASLSYSRLGQGRQRGDELINVPAMHLVLLYGPL